jgi:hypothetical protein
MSISNCKINPGPTPEEVFELMYGPPKREDYPAVRGFKRKRKKHRRAKLETQGKANRRARKNFERAHAYWEKHLKARYETGKWPTENFESFCEWSHKFEMKVAELREPSLYDFLMSK